MVKPLDVMAWTARANTLVLSIAACRFPHKTSSGKVDDVSQRLRILGHHI